jgi:GNAT superfamily N-acetyltransferase
MNNQANQTIHSNSDDLVIEQIRNNNDLGEFIRLPWQIYNDYPHWVPPLLRDVKFKLNQSKHPFFEHAKIELFIARRGTTITGRIAAIVDDRYNEFHKERTGFFGMFECVEDYEAAKALFSSAETWCKNQGMDRIRGPMNLSMNDECGFLLEGFDSDPVMMMPYNPKYYLEFCERYGFVKAKDLYAYLKSDIGVVDRIAKLVERVKKKENVVVRPVNLKDFNREVAIIKDIYNAAWELNWGFVPMTEKEMDLMAKELRPICEPELVLFAEVNGEPVGVSITLPDMNQVLKKLNGKLGSIGLLKFLYYKKKITGARAIVFGIKKEYRLTGISSVLYYETVKRGARLGYTWCEMSWNLEDNDLINRFDEAVGGKLYKKYRIYEKELS